MATNLPAGEISTSPKASLHCERSELCHRWIQWRSVVVDGPAIPRARSGTIRLFVEGFDVARVHNAACASRRARAWGLLTSKELAPSKMGSSMSATPPRERRADFVNA